MKKHITGNTTDIFAADFPTKEQMLNHLEKDTNVLGVRSIKRAFEIVDRKDFVPEEYRLESYEDYPLPLGHGQSQVARTGQVDFSFR